MASRHGLVANASRLDSPLTPRPHHRTGHLRVRLYGPHLPKRKIGVRKDGSIRHAHFGDFYVHYLVCLAWNGARPSDQHMVLHLDDNPTNNDASNLRWGTASENAEHRDMPQQEQREMAERERALWRPSTPADKVMSISGAIRIASASFDTDKACPAEQRLRVFAWFRRRPRGVVKTKDVGGFDADVCIRTRRRRLAELAKIDVIRRHGPNAWSLLC